MDLAKFEKSDLKGKIKNMVKNAETLRAGSSEAKPIDVSFAEMVQETFGMDLPKMYYELGVNPAIDTIQNLTTLMDEDIRWLIPEIFRDALRLGIRNAPIWGNITAAQETTSGLKQIVPHVNMSDAAPRRVGEAETIALGSLSYGSREVSLYKIGRGIKVSDEVVQYSSLNVVSIFLQDFGVKLGHAFDTLAMDVMINGDQADGSMAAPVVGTATGTSKTYADFLKIWIRMSRIGRAPETIIGNEDAALLTLNIDEFKRTDKYGPSEHTIDLKTPVPQKSDYFIHGNIPDNQELLADPARSLVLLTAQPLKVESERIVSNQTEAFYATLTSGFFKLFQDGSIIMDKSKAFSSYGFPSYMDIDPLLNVVIE